MQILKEFKLKTTMKAIKSKIKEEKAPFYKEPGKKKY